MTRTTGRRGLALPALAAAVLGAAAAAGTTSGAIAALRTAATASASWGLAAASSAMTASPGTATTSTVTVAAERGWTGTVTLSATGGPAGLSAAVAPFAVVLTRSAPVAFAAVALTVPAGTAAGTYPVTLTGVSGTTRRTATLTLTVQAPPAVRLAAAPARLVTHPGAPAVTTTLTATTTSVGATTALRYRVSGLPAGTTAAFSTGATTTARTTALTLRTSASTPLGTTTLTVTAATTTGRPAAGTTTLTLVVEAAGRPFTVSGPSVAPVLAPGLTGPLDLSLTNPNATAIEVTALTVSVTRTSDESRCPAATHFRTVPLAAPVTVPAGASRTLSALGVPAAARPAVRMLDLPTNQDACKRVTLTLAYSGTAGGGVR